MRIEILTLFPKMFDNFITESIIKRAIDKEIVKIGITNIRDFSKSKHKNVDDYPYGGESGMVMMVEPIVLAIEFLQKQHDFEEIIFLTPDGELYNQKIANQFSLKKSIIIICGHYKGIDERIRQNWVTREISIGDYVLTGGEIPAMILADSIIRLLPGVLNDETSALNDSFQDGLLSYPVYTRPNDFRGYKVPEILLSGNQKKIHEWKIEQQINRTKQRRPDLFKE